MAQYIYNGTDLTPALPAAIAIYTKPIGSIATMPMDITILKSDVKSIEPYSVSVTGTPSTNYRIRINLKSGGGHDIVLGTITNQPTWANSTAGQKACQRDLTEWVGEDSATGMLLSAVELRHLATFVCVGDGTVVNNPAKEGDKVFYFANEDGSVQSYFALGNDGGPSVVATISEPQQKAYLPEGPFEASIVNGEGGLSFTNAAAVYLTDMASDAYDINFDNDETVRVEIDFVKDATSTQAVIARYRTDTNLATSANGTPIRDGDKIVIKGRKALNGFSVIGTEAGKTITAWVRKYKIHSV